MAERYALYFAPPSGSELWRLAAIGLGRDAATGATLDADLGDIDPEHRHALTKSARRYGFHATIKAPMALDARLEGKDLDRALKAWTAVNAPVSIGRLVLKSLDGFIALVPAKQTAALTEFAGRVVVDFDGFRAPPTEDDKQKRLAGGRLTPRQVELLDRYGYPYVLDEFRLHMTLTDRLQPDDHGALMAAAASFFAPVLGEEVLLDRIVLFHEAEPGAPFTRLRDYPLTGDAV